jgi:hemerythrin superfamily protein
MDVIDLLVADHNRVRGLFSRYNEAEEAKEFDTAGVLASRILEELEIHMAAEEAVFYASVKDRSEELSDDVDEGIEEHHVAKILIGEIKDLEVGSDPWVAKMTVLIESVTHHVDEEEEELFPTSRSSSDTAWRDQLGEKLESQRVDLGAPPLSETMDLSLAELKEKASEQQIPGRSSMGHDELAATVSPQ